MKTQRRRKKRGRRINKGNLAILMVIAVAALVLIGAGIGWLLSNREPAFLKPQVSSSEELKDKSKDVQLAVYYPQSADSTFQEALAQNAEVIFNDLKAQTENYQKEKKPLLVKADYQMNVNQDRYVSLEYTISRNENETVQEQRQSYLYDLTDHQWLDASSLLDENALKWLSANLRAQLKADDNWKEAAYTLPLIEATAWDSGNFSDFTLKDGMLIFNFPAGKLGENAYRWEFPVSNLGEHFLLDIGQGTLPENNVRIAPRVIDPNKPMVALTFDDGPHPTNTPQLINLLQHYDSAATFFMQGVRVEKYPETTLMVINSASEAASHSYNHRS
ncbi:MAG: polysaccharide deacetylase family protein [Holdemania filiformis]